MTPLECPWAGSKDTGIALREAKGMGLALPGLELAERLYRELASLGQGRSGTQALVLALERLAQSDESDLYPPRK